MALVIALGLAPGANAAASGTIGRANLDGTGVDQVFIAGANYPGGVDVDGAHVYWMNKGQGTIGRANLDGTGVDQSFITGVLGDGDDVVVDAAHVYWGSLGTIGRANLDGTGVDQGFVSIDGPPRQHPFPPGPGYACALAVDGEHIYWANESIHTIGRANLDGTGVEQSFIASHANKVCSVAVDAAHLYWATATYGAPETIARANLDGTGVDYDFIREALPKRRMGSLSIAVDNAHLYLLGYSPETYRFGESIWRSDLSGSTIDEFITGGTPRDIAIDGDHVYWTNFEGPDNPLFKRLKKPDLHKRKGTATLSAVVPGPGRLKLHGKGLKAVVKKTSKAGAVELLVRTKRDKRRRLRRHGKVTVTAKITYWPTGGTRYTQSRDITLRKRG